MRDSLGTPACYSSIERQTNKLAGTVTRNLLLHGLSVSVQATDGNELYRCKVQLKPWYFWRKQGSKLFVIDGRPVGVIWDLTAAKFNGKTEPSSDYYVAIVCEEEVVLLLGDLKKDAYLKTRCRPALIEPVLVSRKEHVFGKNRFTTRVKFHEKEKFHDISLECNSSRSDNNIDGLEHQLELKVDGQLAIQVKHLQWKFRGNDSINVSKIEVEVYWDVHDWLFGSGPRHGLFIFKPVSPSPFSPLSTSYLLSSSPSSSLLADQEVVDLPSEQDEGGGGSSSFCLFLHAWKEE